MAFNCAGCGHRHLDMNEAHGAKRYCEDCAERRDFPKGLAETGLTSDQILYLANQAHDHDARSVALRLIADILHDAMPRENAWGRDEKKKIFRAHATCRRLAELFASPKIDEHFPPDCPACGREMPPHMPWLGVLSVGQVCPWCNIKRTREKNFT